MPHTHVLLEHALARLAGSGALVVPPDASDVPPSAFAGHLVHCPFALLPRPIPRAQFEAARALAAPFNELVDAIARQPEWLLAALAQTAEADYFTGRLVGIFKTVLAEGIAQPIYLGIHRSDYMIDERALAADARQPAIRQIELNTVSSAFAGLSSRVAHMHAFLAKRCPAEVAAVMERAVSPDALPPNDSGVAVPAALATAHKLYTPTTGHRTAIAFVVQRRERNIMDQRLLEQELWDAHGVPVVRVTLDQLGRFGRLSDARALTLPCDLMDAMSPKAAASTTDALGAWYEISVVYYRAGYAPSDYSVEADWEARLLAERSAAIKCPSIAYHLCGTKKVQQVLAAPGEVERFVSPAAAAALRASFAGLWSLDAADVCTQRMKEVIAAACEHPEQYVLKPQREGGGNNTYGAAVAEALRGGMSAHQLAAHILMQRVFPQVAPSIFVKGTAATSHDAVSELGVYGVFVGDGRRVWLNAEAGHLLRTKTESSDEGGVAAGYAVLDSPLLV